VLPHIATGSPRFTAAAHRQAGVLERLGGASPCPLTGAQANTDHQGMTDSILLDMARLWQPRQKTIADAR
jgi:hypothetical protein